MPHEPDRFSPRGGPNTGKLDHPLSRSHHYFYNHQYSDIFHTGDHVDILGRSSLNDLVLRVAGGKGDQIEENFVSRIREYADKVKVYEEGEEP